MNTWKLIGVLFILMMAGTAQAEGVSNEDIQCGNNPTCVSPDDLEDERDS